MTKRRMTPARLEDFRLPGEGQMLAPEPPAKSITPITPEPSDAQCPSCLRCAVEIYARAKRRIYRRCKYCGHTWSAAE